MGGMIKLLLALTIALLPSVMFEGATLRVTCKVPRDDRNRGLTINLEGYTSTYIQLEGSASPVTFVRDFSKVPCEVEEVSCKVVRNDSIVEVSRQPVRVICSGGQDE